MIPFTILETIASICSASIFGAIFAILDAILKILTIEFNHIKSIREHVLKAEKIFSIPKKAVTLNKGVENSHRYISEIITFFKVIIFTIGFILLSYYALDGAVRLYLLFFGLGFFLLFQNISDKTLLKIVDSVFSFFYGILVICLRILIRPLVVLVKKTGNYIIRKSRKIEKGSNTENV